jgi:hypothetical protein
VTLAAFPKESVQGARNALSTYYRHGDKLNVLSTEIK